MKSSSAQIHRSGEREFVTQFARSLNVVLYLLIALSLSAALSAPAIGSILPYLCLPLCLGLSILATLMHRTRAAIIVSAINCIIIFSCLFFDLGIMKSLLFADAMALSFGLCLLNNTITWGAAVAFAYMLNEASIADRQTYMLYKVFDALPIGIWVRSRDGRNLFVNERWASFSDLSIDEILDPENKTFPVDLGDRTSRQLDEVLETSDHAVRYRSINLREKSGREANLTLLTLKMFVDQENDYGTLSLIVDETALRFYEEKVRESKHNLDIALNNARMGFWDENLASGVVTCDSNWYGLLGLNPETPEAPLSLWEECLHPDDKARVEDLYDEYYRSGTGAFRIDYRVRKATGSYCWMQDSVTITEYNEDGTPLRVMGTMQDISEQKSIEYELKQARDTAEAANEAKSHFIATVSHEIRTPLNAIIGLSSFLIESDDLNEDSLDLAQTIYSSGNSLMSLVNDILDFSKIEAGHFNLEVQEFPLKLCFKDCIKLFNVNASEKQLKLILELADNLPEFVVGDMMRLRQVIQNLVANSIKFTESGKVVLSVKKADLTELDPACRPDPVELIGYLDQANHEYLQVKVEDTGIGIPEDRQHLLFQAFNQVDTSATRKYGGTGLGLVICRRIVGAMGGRIWVESKEGEGTTFTFVVRINFVSQSTLNNLEIWSPAKHFERLADRLPCDILIVAPDSEAEGLASSARKLGYIPHTLSQLELDQTVFIRRRYNIIFLWLGNEQKAMEQARWLMSPANTLNPECIIGIAGIDQEISIEHSRLNGFKEVVTSDLNSSAMCELITQSIGAHD